MRGGVCLSGPSLCSGEADFVGVVGIRIWPRVGADSEGSPKFRSHPEIARAGRQCHEKKRVQTSNMGA